ncbi:hypothetical protein IMZ48_22600 [Candidatus Bathyarchaeota archaeon]|nr:hypothetical protein [Candidatus Bathyarchaeota archaeon]
MTTEEKTYQISPIVTESVVHNTKVQNPPNPSLSLRSPHQPPPAVAKHTTDTLPS